MNDLPAYVALSAHLDADLERADNQLERCRLIQNALQAAYEQGLGEGVSRFGSLCYDHEKVIAWLVPYLDDTVEGCFGCYMEGLRFAIRREERIALGLPPDDILKGETSE